MRIATWNVNSPRSGYYIAAAGTNQWNGVAVISRVGIEDVQVGFEGMPGWGDPIAAESRAIGATCGGVRVWSLYVPQRPQGRRPALRLQARLAGEAA